MHAWLALIVSLPFFNKDLANLKGDQQMAKQMKNEKLFFFLSLNFVKDGCS